jgi:hypothetical protein
LSTAAPRTERGLARQRTALAWQRTALSLLTGSTLLARLVYPTIGVPALVGWLVAASLSVWVLLVRRPHSSAQDPDSLEPRDGLPGAAVVLAVVVLGMTELLALLARP